MASDNSPMQARFRLEIDHMKHTMLQHFDQYSGGMSDLLDQAIVDGLAEAGKEIVELARQVIREEAGRRARNLAYIITEDPRFKEDLREIVLRALPEAGL